MAGIVARGRAQRAFEIADRAGIGRFVATGVAVGGPRRQFLFGTRPPLAGIAQVDRLAAVRHQGQLVERPAPVALARLDVQPAFAAWSGDRHSVVGLAVVAAAITGACFGFLWWNASPAQIIMGDTGSLALGGAMAGFAIMTRTELLLVIIGGLFVAVTLSVMLQVSYFKVTRRMTGVGKRIFRMTPLHHHFEMLGWEQVNVVIRFWIITGLSVAAGLGVFYAEWVAGA